MKSVIFALCIVYNLQTTLIVRAQTAHSIASHQSVRQQALPRRSAASSPRTNVLFIIIDDLRPALGCYGDPLVHTPHIDALAKKGVVFDRAYCQEAVCAPSRTSFMTGLRPDKIRVWGLTTLFRNTMPAVVTLPQYFSEHGYVSAEVGKIYHDPASHQDPLSWTGPVIYNVTEDKKGHKYVLDRNLTGGKGEATERQEVDDSAYIDGKVADAAINVLQQLAAKPFFLAVGFRRPHLPFSAPEKYWQLYDHTNFPIPDSLPALYAPAIALHRSEELRGYRGIPQQGAIPAPLARQLWQGYYAAISYVDAQVGHLLKALDNLHLSDHTIIVLISDHGYHLGEEGLWCKSTNFEIANRVPLIIAAPGVKGNGQTTQNIAELLDLYPTLLDLCQLPSQPTAQGISLVPQLNNPTRPTDHIALSQFIRPYAALNHEDRIESMGYTIRTNQYRYTEWYRFGTDTLLATELYDHTKGDAETINSFQTASPALRDSLHAQLIERSHYSASSSSHP